MNKKKLEAMLAKLDSRMAALLTNSDSSEDVKELRGINSEMEAIKTDQVAIRSMLKEIEDEEAAQRNADPLADPEQRAAAPKPADANAPDQRQILGSYMSGMSAEVRKEVLKGYETRGADLKAGKAIVVSMVETEEERAVSLGASNLIVQKKYSNTLNETFNEVSSVIDKVNAVPLTGGESYTKGFDISFGEAGYTTETGDYTDGDPVTDYVEIGKAKITAYTEITDEAQKLPNVDYLALVVKNVRLSIRKKITRQILIGAGGTNAITGIFNAPVNVIPLASDIEISAIDEDTLDKIVFAYGGDEDVEGGAYLILNKKDLAAFAAIRLTDGKKAYKIKLDATGNSGSISSEDSFSVPFIINSVCPALSLVGTADDTYCMAYGKLMSYEMPVFSRLTVEESRDYKFRSGQIAYRGSIWVGGNVASYKGFARIKKVAAV